MELYNFAMVLSDSQLELLALTLGITETNKTALAEHFRNELPDRFTAFMSTVMRRPLNGNKVLRAQPCTWNMLLRRRFVIRIRSRLKANAETREQGRT